MLDIDLDGNVDPLTDGLLIVRYLLGVRNAALVQDVLGTMPMRPNPTDIANYLATLTPP